MCWRHCNLAASEPGSSFVQFVFQGSLREKSSNTLQLPSLTETLSEKKGRAFGFVLPFPNPLDMWTLGCAQSCGIHNKNKDWQLDHLFIDLCCGCTGLRCSFGCAAESHLPGTCGLNRLDWMEYKVQEGKWWDLSCSSQACWCQGAALSACTSWALRLVSSNPLQLGSWEIALVDLEASGLWISAD